MIFPTYANFGLCARKWGKCTIAFHCSGMASISDGTSGQSKILKKGSKLLTRAFQIIYFILSLIYRCIRLKKKKIMLGQFLGPKHLIQLWTPTVPAPIPTSYELNRVWRHTSYSDLWICQTGWVLVRNMALKLLILFPGDTIITILSTSAKTWIIWKTSFLHKQNWL